MSDYDNFRPLERKDWAKGRSWVINRILFLLNLQADKPDQFYGYAGPDIEKMTKEYPKTFSFELYQLKILLPDLYFVSQNIFIDDWFMNRISYVEENNGSTGIRK